MAVQGPFKLVAGHAVLDFVNTLDDVYAASGPIELIPTYEDLLRFAEQSGVMESDEVAQLRQVTSAGAQIASLQKAHALRDCLRAIFSMVIERADVHAEFVDSLNRLVTEALMHRQLTVQKGRAHWAWKDVEADANAPIWILTLQAVDLLLSDELAAVKACANQSCRWLFWDTSKNGKRRWCDMQLCGNRAKARSHYQRTSKKAYPSTTN